MKLKKPLIWGLIIFLILMNVVKYDKVLEKLVIINPNGKMLGNILDKAHAKVRLLLKFFVGLKFVIFSFIYGSYFMFVYLFDHKHIF
jgi:hypothetical protein